MGCKPVTPRQIGVWWGMQECQEAQLRGPWFGLGGLGLRGPVLMDSCAKGSNLLCSKAANRSYKKIGFSLQQEALSKCVPRKKVVPGKWPRASTGGRMSVSGVRRKMPGRDRWFSKSFIFIHLFRTTFCQKEFETSLCGLSFSEHV